LHWNSGAQPGNLTIKNKYPLWLQTCSTERFILFLDLRAGYYQVRIAEGEEQKTTCMTSKVRCLYIYIGYAFFFYSQMPLPPSPQKWAIPPRQVVYFDRGL
jgi:hypothetical protein